MKFNHIIDESLIKVPEAISKVADKYLASCLYTIIFNYANIQNNKNAEVKKDDNGYDKSSPDVQRALSTLQTKFGASRLSESSLKRLVDTYIKLPIDMVKVAKELEYKSLTPEIRQEISKSYVALFLSSVDLVGVNGSAAHNEGSGVVTIKIDIHDIVENPRGNLYKRVMQIFSTLHHELKHQVQFLVLSKIDKSGKQIKSSGISDDGTINHEEYYASPIEFSPQLGNLVDAISLKLQDMFLSGSNSTVQKDLTKALNEVVQTNTSQRDFIISVYRSDKDKYRRILKTVYKECEKTYNVLAKSKDELTHILTPEVSLGEDVDILLSITTALKPNNSYELVMYGKDINNLTSVTISSSDFKLKISSNGTDQFNANLTHRNGSESFILESTKLIKLITLMARAHHMDYEELYGLLQINSIGDEDVTYEVLDTLVDIVSDYAKALNLEVEVGDDYIDIGKLQFDLALSKETIIISTDKHSYVVRVDDFVDLMELIVLAVVKYGYREIFEVLDYCTSYVALKVELTRLFAEDEE